MTWDRDFRVSLIEFHPIGQDPALQIEGLQNADLQANPEVRREVASGSIFAKTASLQRIAPIGRFQTFNIAQAITALTLNGACIENDGTHPGLTVYFEKRDCKGPAAGSVHMSYTVPKGVIAPQSLTVDHRGDAVMTFQIWAAYDGSNKPVVIAHQEAIPASAGGADKKFTMNKMNLTGTPAVSIEGKRNISIEFNPVVASEGADSDIFDSVQSLSSLLSTMTVTGVDPQWFKADTNPEIANTVVDDITTGRSITGANTLTMYLKDRDQAVGSAAHISLVMRGLINPNSIITGGPTNPSEASFQIDTIEDGVNAPIIATTGVVIP